VDRGSVPDSMPCRGGREKGDVVENLHFSVWGEKWKGTLWKIDTFVLDPQLIGDTADIVKAAMKKNARANLIVNNRPSGTPPYRRGSCSQAF
jgi:hypothetical protein